VRARAPLAHQGARTQQRIAALPFAPQHASGVAAGDVNCTFGRAPARAMLLIGRSTGREPHQTALEQRPPGAPGDANFTTEATSGGDAFRICRAMRGQDRSRGAKARPS
jgi:hypothetical protein